jgi:hypothetical protein
MDMPPKPRASARKGGQRLAFGLAHGHMPLYDHARGGRAQGSGASARISSKVGIITIKWVLIVN